MTILNWRSEERTDKDDFLLLEIRVHYRHLILVIKDLSRFLFQVKLTLFDDNQIFRILILYIRKQEDKHESNLTLNPHTHDD